jgi:hypothetical protein
MGWQHSSGNISFIISSSIEHVLEQHLNIDQNFDHQMSLSKSKCWYSNNCLYFLKQAVPLYNNLFYLLHLSSRIYTHLATMLYLAMLQWFRAQTIAPPTPFPLWPLGHKKSKSPLFNISRYSWMSTSKNCLFFVCTKVIWSLGSQALLWC